MLLVEVVVEVVVVTDVVVVVVVGFGAVVVVPVLGSLLALFVQGLATNLVPSGSSPHAISPSTYIGICSLSEFDFFRSVALSSPPRYDQSFEVSHAPAVDLPSTASGIEILNCTSSLCSL